MKLAKRAFSSILILSLSCAMAANAPKITYSESTENFDYTLPESQGGGKAHCNQTIRMPLTDDNNEIPSVKKVIQSVLDESGCASSKDFMESGDEFNSTFDFKIAFQNEEFITLTETYDSYLGGAHPESGSITHIIDIKNNSEINQEQLFLNEKLTEAKKYISDLFLEKISQNITTHTKRVENRISNLESRISKLKKQPPQEKTITKLMKQLEYLKNDLDIDNQCEDVYKESSDYFSLSPRKKGLVVNVPVPHYALGCDRVVYMSYSELKEFLDTNSIIGKLLKK